MAEMNFGGVIETVVTSKEFSLEKAREVLKDETIAVIGYGIQGPGQACNLRDNGFNVIVGQREGPVARPDDPTNGVYAIDNWYLGDEVYDFSTPVTSDINLKVEWSNKALVTLSLNYTGTPTIKTFKTLLDTPLAEDDENLAVEDRIGFFFEGWYDDPAFETPHNFSGNVEGPFTLYAKLTGDIYKIVADNGDGSTSYDKFILDWTSSETIKAKLDSVISFRFRSTVAFDKFNVRGSNKWVYETGSDTLTTYTVEDDGWISVSYKFADKYYDGTTAVEYGENGLPFRFDLISNKITIHS